MKVPGATYRLQVNAAFRLSKVHQLVDYFEQLGITDLYLSPVLEARPGSTHGYDVTHPGRLNHEVGTEEELTALSSALRERGMGVVLDMVPNHMAASEENPWWRDVLEHGPASRYARYFDIDWTGDPTGLNRVILPMLGRAVTECLDADEIRVVLGEGEPAIAYFDRRLPIDPATYPLMVRQLGSAASARLREIARAAERIPSREQTDRAEERWRMAESIKLDFAEALLELPAVELSRAAVAAVLEAQAYALTYWRRGSELVNYRRFFDISDLAGLRTERDDVFSDTHDRVLTWIAAGTVRGVRIDHIDGLRDPAGYLRQLGSATQVPVYSVVEKILIGEEPLPTEWSTAGTTGYDFCAILNGLFIDERGWHKLRDAYVERGGSPSFVELVYEAKKLVIRELFAGEARTLARRMAASTQLGVDECHAALTELTALLPVYRTYRTEAGISAHDQRLIAETATRARTRGAPVVAIDALERLLLEPAGDAQHELAMRWQQFTGPVTAKGLEDTAFYNYHPLISVCEVGTDPSDPVITIERFHDRMLRRAGEWRATLNATSTHDTKRGEDVRARINVLSELADEWVVFAERWLDRETPDREDAQQLYQALVGAWPLADQIDQEFRARIHGFLEKAAREGKRRSSWKDPNPEYEAALRAYADRLLDDREFCSELRAFLDRSSFYGALNSLSQVVLKLGAPGVPDFYQGTELWALQLVDPDNRRPVDFEQRRRADVAAATADLRQNWRDGRIKLAVTHRGLALRKNLQPLFADGEYHPVAVRGALADHVIAFERRLGTDRVVFAAGRFFARLAAPEQWPIGDFWADTRLELDSAALTETLTAKPVSAKLADIFGELPVAILQAD